MRSKSTGSDGAGVEKDIWTICDGAKKAIGTLLDSTFQHLRSKDNALQNQLLIKDLELYVLRDCLKQAEVDYDEAKTEEKSIAQSYLAVPERPLPNLPFEIISHILSLAYRDSFVRLRDFDAKNKIPAGVDSFLRTLELVDPGGRFRQFVLSSATCIVRSKELLCTENKLRAILARSIPARLDVMLDLVRRRGLSEEKLGRGLSFLSQTPGRWNSLMMRGQCGMQLHIFQALRRCIPVLVHIEYLQIMVTNPYDEHYEVRWDESFTGLIHVDCVPKLRSANIPLEYLGPFVSSGLLSAVSSARVEPVLQLFADCMLEEFSLVVKEATRMSSEGELFLGLLDEWFPHLSVLETNWPHLTLLSLLSIPKKDKSWHFPALHTLNLLKPVDSTRLTTMLRARRNAPNVVSIKHLRLTKGCPKGDDVLALYEIGKLVPNVIWSEEEQ
ncbi:hypothetical protein DFH11DRAFT_1543257 [Phellopilus nigrolimitatus]|nr:hypothetical protein DFH11DRAFT_1543257 [Phellopilus nigrolimitatus]